MAAILTRKTIQSLAVLRAVSKWQRGAYGPVRIHKTLFFADNANPPEWRLFTFKKWCLGQYSDTIADALNNLRDAGRITSRYDGPSERIVAKLGSRPARAVRLFFREYFPDWDGAFEQSFKTWAYLETDRIIEKAHDDPSYTESEYGKQIFECKMPDRVEFSGLSGESAEDLTDLVDGRLQAELSSRLSYASEKQVVAEDWRKKYFNGDK